VWVASFPSGQARRPVSVQGGEAPKWRGDGHELFYVSPQKDLMALSISTRDTDFEANIPAKLFSIGSTAYSASVDGRQFLVSVDAPYSDAPPIGIILNWTTLLERR
jgi:hypothetical protein